jgi:hypothetical protein
MPVSVGETGSKNWEGEKMVDGEIMVSFTLPWRLKVQAERSVGCRSCDYMGVEWTSLPASEFANGCCTKCGAMWTTHLSEAERTEANRSHHERESADHTTE